MSSLVSKVVGTAILSLTLSCQSALNNINPTNNSCAPGYSLCVPHNGRYICKGDNINFSGLKGDVAKIENHKDGSLVYLGRLMPIGGTELYFIHVRRIGEPPTCIKR